VDGKTLTLYRAAQNCEPPGKRSEPKEVTCGDSGRAE
jgi:hypothetical protein